MSQHGSLRIAKTLNQKYTGYLGESVWRSKAKRWFARLVHKANRRFAKASIEAEVQDLRDNGAI